MNNTDLLSNISKALNEICEKNRIIKVNEIVITVDNNWGISESNLHEYLCNKHKSLVGEWTNINVIKDSLKDDKAIIRIVHGKKA
jgi:hypothetical protein